MLYSVFVFGTTKQHERRIAWLWLFIVFAFNYDNNYAAFMLGIRTHMHMRVISHMQMARIHHASCMVDVDGDGENRKCKMKMTIDRTPTSIFHLHIHIHPALPS